MSKELAEMFDFDSVKKPETKGFDLSDEEIEQGRERACTIAVDSWKSLWEQY